MQLVQDRFDKEAGSIEAARDNFDAEWKDLLPLFSRIVIQSTESPWVQSEYICVVSSIHPGLSNWWGNKVAVKYDRSPAYKRRILAHEILLSHVFQLLRRHHPVWISPTGRFGLLPKSRLCSFWTTRPCGPFGPTSRGPENGLVAPTILNLLS